MSSLSTTPLGAQMTGQMRGPSMVIWLCGASVLVFLLYPAHGRSPTHRPSIVDLVLIGLTVLSIGYWIDQRFAGRGVMPRAVAMVVDHCFGDMALHRIEIAIRPENTNSLRVMEKLDIGEVGYAPRYLHIDNAWRDHRLFAITKEEVPLGLLRRWEDSVRRPQTDVG